MTEPLYVPYKIGHEKRERHGMTLLVPDNGNLAELDISKTTERIGDSEPFQSYLDTYSLVYGVNFKVPEDQKYAWIKTHGGLFPKIMFSKFNPQTSGKIRDERSFWDLSDLDFSRNLRIKTITTHYHTEQLPPSRTVQSELMSGKSRIEIYVDELVRS